MAPTQGCPTRAVPGACNFRDQQGRRRDFSGSNDAPGDHKDWEWRRMSAHFKSAISRLRPTSERRARTTAVATLAAAQNGTSGVLAGGKHARRLAGLATPRTGSGAPQVNPVPVYGPHNGRNGSRREGGSQRLASRVGH